jgi:hypothetical protein
MKPSKLPLFYNVYIYRPVSLTHIFSHNVDFVKKPGAPPELCLKNIVGKDVEVRTLDR